MRVVNRLGRGPILFAQHGRGRVPAAAELLSESRSDPSPARLAGRYAQAIQDRYAPRFAAYDMAQRWTSRAWLLNLLARRANAGTFARRELKAMIAETGDPRTLFSP